MSNIRNPRVYSGSINQNWTGLIPENPPILGEGSNEYRDIKGQAEISRVRDRALVAPVVIPAMPKLIEVTEEKFERRNFGQSPIAQTETRRRG